MRTWLSALVLLAAFSLASPTAAQVLPREVRERILEAVVEVLPYDLEAGRLVGTGGSGSIISSDGYVLTNYHVVGDDLTGHFYTWHVIRITDPRHPDRAPRHAYWARFVAGDARHDLAIIRIELLADESPLPPGTRFTSVPLGDANTLMPGDPITVVGYPGIGGATVTVTTGIVSGWVGEDFMAGGKQWIKTDARISGGNSGGGAFDERGYLVAVPTFKIQSNVRMFEEQNLLRPLTLALPLITAHVPNVDRSDGYDAVRLPTPVPTPTPTPAPAPAPSPTPPAPVVGTITGALRPGAETLASGEYVDVIERTFSAGVPVELYLRSSTFDVYLIVVSPTGDVVLDVDDTPGEGLDVRETLVPPQTGSYLLVVTSAFPGETGSYLLDIRPTSATTPPSSPFAVMPEPDPSGPGPSASTPPPGAFDPFATPAPSDVAPSSESLSGTLRSSDQTLPGGEHYHLIERYFVAGVPVELYLRSSEFDVYLAVATPNGDVLFEIDDTPGEGLDVRETFEPPLTGSYAIVVTSAFANETGSYQLDIRVGHAPPLPSGSDPSTRETITGALAHGDETLASGEYTHMLRRTFSAGVPVTFALRSSAFDARLLVAYVEEAEGRLVLDVSASPGHGTNVHETFVPETSGTYALLVTSTATGAVGAYELELTVAAAAPVNPLLDPARRPQPAVSAAQIPADTAQRALDPTRGTVGHLPLGASVQGHLRADDRPGYHTYVIEVPPGTARVTFTVGAMANVDLFAKHGSDIVSWSEDGDWEHAFVSGAAEASITVDTPRPGRWYVDVVFPLGGPASTPYTFAAR